MFIDKFEPVAQEMSFIIFLIYISGGPFVQRSEPFVQL